MFRSRMRAALPTRNAIRLWLRALGPLVVVLQGGPDKLGAQEVIPDRVTCSSCSIEFVETQRIGDLPGQELLDDITRWIMRDPDGRIWVPNSTLPHVLQVYDSTGRYETFSRKGSGPGEFTGVEMMACFGKDFLLVDSRARFSQLNPRTGAVATLSTSADIGLRRTMAFLPMGDSSVWVASPSRHPDLLGFPISVVNPFTGKTTSTFGKKFDHFDRTVERYLQRFLGQLSDNRVISVQRFAYDIEVYARNGRQLRHLIRDAEWFRPQLEGGSLEAFTMGVHPLGEHRLAVFTAVRERGFLDLFFEEPDPRTFDEGWNTVVEVIDIRSRAVLARKDVPFVIVGPVCPTGEIAALVRGEELPIDHLRLFRMTFKVEN